MNNEQQYQPAAPRAPEPQRVVRVGPPGFPVNWGYPVGSPQQVFNHLARIHIVRYLHCRQRCPRRILQDELEAFPAWITQRVNHRPFFRSYPLTEWESLLIEGAPTLDFELVFRRAVREIPETCQHFENSYKIELITALVRDRFRWVDRIEVLTPTPSPEREEEVQDNLVDITDGE